MQAGEGGALWGKARWVSAGLAGATALLLLLLYFRTAAGPPPHFSFIIQFYVWPHSKQPEFSAPALLHRLQVYVNTLALLADKLSAAGYTSELLIVHWNATRELLLHRRIDFSPPIPLPFVRIIEVDPSGVAAAPLCTKQVNPVVLYSPAESAEQLCHEFSAKNIGARHARGKYLVIMNLDAILPDTYVEFLTGLDRKSEALFWAKNRINLNHPIPLHLTQQEQWARAAEEAAIANTSCKPCTGDFMVLSRDLMHRMRGYAEIGLTFHIESTFADRAKSVKSKLKEIAPPIFHQYHPPSDGRANLNIPDVRARAKKYYRIEHPERWGLFAPSQSMRSVLLQNGHFLRIIRGADMSDRPPTEAEKRVVPARDRKNCI